jgi:hypothetical protein
MLIGHGLMSDEPLYVRRVALFLAAYAMDPGNELEQFSPTDVAARWHRSGSPIIDADALSQTQRRALVYSPGDTATGRRNAVEPWPDRSDQPQGRREPLARTRLVKRPRNSAQGAPAAEGATRTDGRSGPHQARRVVSRRQSVGTVGDAAAGRRVLAKIWHPLIAALDETEGPHWISALCAAVDVRGGDAGLPQAYLRLREITLVELACGWDGRETYLAATDEAGTFWLNIGELYQLQAG